jgi:glycosyltransferase involved in cell wall biosynthesis
VRTALGQDGEKVDQLLHPDATAQDSGLLPTSVVVATYNRAANLSEIVRHVIEDPFPIEVVVVVDGSDDGSMAVLEELKARDSRLTPVWQSNAGEMGARQTGVEHATGEVVVILDDDVLVSPGLFRGHSSWHSRNAHLLVLGYTPTELPTPRSAESFATHIYAAEYERRCMRYEANPDTILRNLWAGNFSLKRSDAIAIGLRNPQFSARYHPDREFGLRCLKAGMVGAFDRDLAATHRYERSLKSFRADARAQGEGVLLLHQLHPDLLGPRSGTELESDLPSPIRAAIKLGQHPSLYRPTTAMLSATLLAAGRFGFFSLQTALAKLLRRIEQGHSAAAATRNQRLTGVA